MSEEFCVGALDDEDEGRRTRRCRADGRSTTTTVHLHGRFIHAKMKILIEVKSFA